ncbi:MAG: cytochrome c oxidase accessory protein CcoG [Sulfuriflexus sp.]|nr:cytochrome c oxidase accessory protein CcoG [Sulfuriflexus sp.]
MANKETKKTEHPDSLYASAEKIYPRAVSGLFAMWRSIGVVILLGIYYLAPWLEWADRQAILFDLPNRKFHVFGLIFWPQDFFYFAVLLIIAAFALFFFTAIAGRLWCGYACPQTVWTEVFMWIARKVEGDRPKQIKLDKMPWNAYKIRIKATKHFLWLALAAYTGFTFVGYFTPIDELTLRIFDLDLGPWEWFWIVFYSFATWGNAGFMREQVCIYMCPYARFQSAMFDNDTLIISYNEERGEPRGSRKRNEDPATKNLGSCIDCTLCVQVCPTGIDIRNGLQYQCIACSACIDVCDGVMDKMGYERGLIKYTTENARQGKVVSLFRPRIIVYASALLLMTIGLTYAIATRIPLEVDIIRDRTRLFNETDTGLIENIYSMQIINKDEQVHQYQITASGINGMKMIIKSIDIEVAAGEVLDVPLRLQVDPYDLKKRSTEVMLSVVSTDNPDIRMIEATRFLGPTGRR